jgi:hypothetical protein
VLVCHPPLLDILPIRGPNEGELTISAINIRLVRRRCQGCLQPKATPGWLTLAGVSRTRKRPTSHRWLGPGNLEGLGFRPVSGSNPRRVYAVIHSKEPVGLLR